MRGEEAIQAPAGKQTELECLGAEKQEAEERELKGLGCLTKGRVEDSGVRGYVWARARHRWIYFMFRAIELRSTTTTRRRRVGVTPNSIFPNGRHVD